VYVHVLSTTAYTRLPIQSHTHSTCPRKFVAPRRQSGVANLRRLADPLSIIFLRHGDLAPPWLQLCAVQHLFAITFGYSQMSTGGTALDNRQKEKAPSRVGNSRRLNMVATFFPSYVRT